MTVTIEVKPEVAHRWKAIAEREGRELDALISEALEERAAAWESKREYSQVEIARKLALIDALPTTNNRAGLPELDLSGSRADVYGYTEREDAQL